MIRLIISVFIVVALAVSLPGCASTRKSRAEMRGLMLLENTQLGRNKGYYSKHKSKEISKTHRKYENRKKHKSFKKSF
jgi:hypothetical protein